MSNASDILSDTSNTLKSLKIAGELGFCDPRGALFFPDHQLLVVSDLHLEKGSSFARGGQFLPPYDTGATLDLLEAVVALHQPRTIISLGDSFHDGNGAARLPQVYREKLLAIMHGREWLWILGNHDPDAPADLPGMIETELELGKLRFRHEPSAGVSFGEIAGHLHPGATVLQRGRTVRRRCFASDGNRLIMPAFGAYTGMLNVLHPVCKALFCWEKFVAYMLGEKQVYAISHNRLRE